MESQGYQAITTLSHRPVTDGPTILQMALVKRNGAGVTVCDTFNSGIRTVDDTLKGDLIGILLGIQGGCIGILLMGSTGALAGSMVDAGDALDDASLIEVVGDKLHEGGIALIALADEENESILDGKLAGYNCQVLRYDAAVISAEVAEAEKMQREMERQTRLKLRQTRREDAKKGIEEGREKLKAEFEAFKAKLKK